MSVRIVTNGHRRELLALDQIPESVRPDFDYVTGEEQYSPRFVEYRGRWYDTSDTEGRPRFAPQWHHYISDTLFSGVLFRFEDDYETVIVGTYYAND